MIGKLLVNFFVAIKVNKKSMCGLPIKKKKKKEEIDVWIVGNYET